MTELVRRRAILKGTLATAAMLPFVRSAPLLAQAADDYIARYVHPELRPMAAQLLPYFDTAPPLSLTTLSKFRDQMNAHVPPKFGDVPVEKRQIEGRRGFPPVTVYVINARPGEHGPAILHTHGGGFVGGRAEGAVGDLQKLCKALGCAAVTVDYRLAPETTYAGSIEDNYAALKWLHGNAPSLGVDPARIAVMGESAGGGHAALLAITARDRGEVPLAFQCLIYPMLDDRTASSRTMPAQVGRLVWNPQSNRFGWRSFLGTAPGGQGVTSRAVPARTENLSGLPPAFIGVGSLDLFCDEDVEYARRLNHAGVSAELIVVPGAFHGFDGAPVPVSRWFNAAKLDALRAGLGIPVAVVS